MLFWARTSQTANCSRTSGHSSHASATRSRRTTFSLPLSLPLGQVVWCEKELALTVTRGLNGNRVTALPMRLEAVTTPSFLTDVLYAVETTSRRSATSPGKRVAVAVKTRVNTGTTDANPGLRRDKAGDQGCQWLLVSAMRRGALFLDRCKRSASIRLPRRCHRVPPKGAGGG
jgi:hypothetical protein